jgi:hypothetical protein
MMQVEGSALHPHVAVEVALVYRHGGAVLLKQPGEGQATGAAAYYGYLLVLKIHA